MKLSRKFLSEYVDLGTISDFDLAEAMTSVGNEYESITPISTATNLVIGYVKTCTMHPDSDHLHVCTVTVGSGEDLNIVCGAPNVSALKKVIVALVGAELPGGVVIKKGNIRGQESNGMLCSLGELGIEHKYLSEEDKMGIHILADDAPLGEDPLAYLNYDDTSIDFELTSNRGDLLSVIGMAYEVGAILNKPVKLPTIKIMSEEDDINNYLSLNVTTDTCPLYLLRMVKNVTIKESPNWLKARLLASGIRSINNVVDISNYIMLEYGQPLHFFDYASLGAKVNVRCAEDSEKLTTLDKQVRTLTKNDIVIANEQEVVALAGVMGGLNSEVEITTKDIVIESAIFNASNVRLTSKTVLRSEASNRFEKGLDPERTYLAINRACELLELYASGTVIKGELIHDKTIKENKVIEITKARINKVLGMTLTSSEILDVMKRLAFLVTVKEDTFLVEVPSRRMDISIPEDLIEEVGRIHGIENVHGTLPIGTGTAGSYERNYLKEKEVRSRLLSHGLSQVITYTLTSPLNVKKYTLDDFTPIELKDPMLDDRKYLRYSLIPSLLNVADYNMSRKTKDIAIHEISNIYYKTGDDIIEEKKLAALITGNVITNEWQHLSIKSDFYYTKGIVEDLLNYLGFNRRYSFESGTVPKEYHPYQSAIIKIDRDIIGYIGMVHPKISKTPIFVFELNLTKIMNISIRQIKDKEISKYPSISKDMAFSLDKEVVVADVIQTIRKAGGKLLSNINIFDVYEGENIEANKKSIAFNLTFMDPTRTLNDEEVMTIFNKIISSVVTTNNGVLRDK
ncbi:MAG: phenylalanine--tRNA ligase subunit beta [Bacilli bacterium]